MGTPQQQVFRMARACRNMDDFCALIKGVPPGPPLRATVEMLKPHLRFELEPWFDPDK